MSLVFGGTTCSICNKRLEHGDRIFATSGVFLPASNTLQVFCDTAMHWKCYITWNKRKEFAFEYSKVIIEDEKNNVFWAKVYLDNNFL